MPDETTVVVQSNEEPEENSPDVAAVAAGASGVALAESINAQQQAAQATEAATEAAEQSMEARIASMTVQEQMDELRRLVLAREMRDAAAPTAAPAPVEEPASLPGPAPELEPLGPREQEPPKSVGKGKKKSFRERWEGSDE